MVEPPRAVGTSVLPDEDAAHAEAEAVAAGIPADVLRSHGATVRQTNQRAHVVVLDVPAEQQAALVAALAARGIVARPPLPVQPMLNESVPFLHVPAVWKAGFDGHGIRVAIVDTGIDATHPDLKDRIAAMSDFTGASGAVDGSAKDDVGHGTHVAGTVAGGGSVYRGVAPGASLVIAKALSAAGGTEDAVLAAMSWASKQQVQVMNLSLGGPGSPTSPLSREVDALAAEGIIVCVAAGNAGPAAKTISSPGDAKGALTVGAADKTGALAFYSSRGPVPGVRYSKPDLTAIGGGVTQGAACACRRPHAGSMRRAAALRTHERDVDGHAARRRDLRAPPAGHRRRPCECGRARGSRAQGAGDLGAGDARYEEERERRGPSRRRARPGFAASEAPRRRLRRAPYRPIRRRVKVRPSRS